MNENPYPTQMLACVDFVEDYHNPAEDVDSIESANVATSRVMGSKVKVEPPQAATHKPLLDIDMPVTLIPSTTPGHFHLFIDHEMPWPKYAALLEALRDAGIVEQGYVDASFQRGYTAVRLPWIKKETS